jgi:hypothetical protein
VEQTRVPRRRHLITRTWHRADPGSEYDQLMIGWHHLSDLIGRWEGDEQLSATPWTDAGTARGQLSIVAGPGGGLILDYIEIGTEGPTLTAHGVLAGDQWWWFDSYGFIPTFIGTAQWVDDDDELVLERKSLRGRTITGLMLADGHLHHRIDTATPVEAELIPLLRGDYHRVD